MGRNQINAFNLVDESVSPSRVIWFLAWPTIIEQILQSMIQYVDSAMVGSLGSSATAAIAINTSTIWLLNGIMSACALGFSILVAREVGRKNYEKAQAVVKNSIIATVILSLALTLIMELIAPFLPIWLGAEEQICEDASFYMQAIAAAFPFTMSLIVFSSIIRSSGDTRTSLIFNLASNVINIVLNYFFIFPSKTITLGSICFVLPRLGMGVRGAAIASSIASLICGIGIFFALFIVKQPSRIKFERTGWKPNMELMKTAAYLGAPVAFERVTICFGQIMLTKMVSSLGTVALASHHLANTAESITYLPPSGFATASTTLVAQAVGSNNKKLAEKYGNLCTIYGVALMSLMGALMYIFAPQLMRVFTSEEAVITLGTSVLRIEAFAEPFFGVSLLVFGALRGVGDTKRPFLISIIGMWIIRLPLAFVLVNYTNLGLRGAWTAMMLDLSSRGIFCLVIFFKKKWINTKKSLA